MDGVKWTTRSSRAKRVRREHRAGSDKRAELMGPGDHRIYSPCVRLGGRMKGVVLFSQTLKRSAAFFMASLEVAPGPIFRAWGAASQVGGLGCYGGGARRPGFE